MTKANRLYGSLLMNVFILSPLAFQTYNPSLAISFSGLAYLMCPIMVLAKSRCHYTANGLIILLGHCLILVYILVRAYAVL